jgi:Fe-S-cluster containining protein
MEFIYMKSTCDRCGLCCQRLIVEADVVDVLREPRIETERPLGRRDASLHVLDACWIVAAPGRPCPFLARENRCRIYPTRPQICVAFAAGSAQCQELREQCGLRALSPLPPADGVLGEIQAELFDKHKNEPAGITSHGPGSPKP